MKNSPPPPKVEQLLHDLQHNADLRHQPVTTSGLDPQLAALRAWQAARLAQTYADLLAEKQYRPACLFFLSDIYAPRDFSQRDYDAERIHSFLARVVPAHMLQLLTDVVELNALTTALDAHLLRVLITELDFTTDLTTALYAEAYIRCDNRTEREQQIDLIGRVVAQVSAGSNLPGVGLALKVVRGPAHTAGWVEVFDFLERGYAAFKPMRRAEGFIQTVTTRETRILDRLLARHPHPFALEV